MRAELWREKPGRVLGRCQVRKSPKAFPSPRSPCPHPLRDRCSLSPAATSSHTPRPACLSEPESTDPRPSSPPIPTALKERKPLGKTAAECEFNTFFFFFSGPFGSFPPPHRDAPSDSTTLGSEPAAESGKDFSYER